MNAITLCQKMPWMTNTIPNKNGTTEPKFTLPNTIKMAQSTIITLPIVINKTRPNRMSSLGTAIQLFKGNIFTESSTMLLF